MTSEGDISVKSQTNRMLSRIYRKLEIEQIKWPRKRYGDLDGLEGVERASKLTGLKKQTLYDLGVNASFPVDIPNRPICRLHIKKELEDFILKKKVLPTTVQLFEALDDKLPYYMDIGSFKKQLVQYDFVWKWIPGYETFVVMERPCVAYERYSFCKRFLEWADAFTPIFFIDEIGIGTNKLHNLQESIKTEDLRGRVIYAASENVVLSKVVNAYNELEFKQFVTDTLLPNLRQPSVIVMNNAKHHCESIVSSKPSIDSLKGDLKKWLDKHNVPYDSNMTRAELYLLAERCTNIDGSIYVIDRMVQAQGHMLLRLPDQIDSLTPTTFLFETVEKEFSTYGNQTAEAAQEHLLNLLNHISSVVLTPEFNVVIDNIRVMFEEDQAVEEALDYVIVRMTCCNVGGEADSDIPDLSDSE